MSDNTVNQETLFAPKNLKTFNEQSAPQPIRITLILDDGFDPFQDRRTSPLKIYGKDDNDANSGDSGDCQ